jgi:uncharacterized protein YgiM (DUF1202 family)
MDMNRFNGTLNELMEFAGVRIPVVNLNEVVDTLHQKVTDLESTVSSIQQTENGSTPAISGRVGDLEGQISTLGGSIATVTTMLTQRIAAVEQQIANIGLSPSLPPVPQFDPPAPIPAPTNPPVTFPSLSSDITYATCITSALNVRSGPGASYPMVSGLKYGQRVKVLKRQNGWAQFENPAGWSSEAYLTFNQDASPTPVETPQPEVLPAASFGICNTSGLNIRSGPAATYPIVGGLTYGQRVKILSHKNNWAQIESPSGWCNESYLSFA